MRTLTITLLLSVCLCALANRRYGGNHYRPCCTEVTSVNISSAITGNMYEEQAAKGACVKAVILRTKKGKVCADPEAKWVQNIIANMTAGNL